MAFLLVEWIRGVVGLLTFIRGSEEKNEATQIIANLPLFSTAAGYSPAEELNLRLLLSTSFQRLHV